MELRDESDNVMTADEMQKRTDDILAQMDEKGISDKKLRKSVAKVKEEPSQTYHYYRATVTYKQRKPTKKITF